MIIDSIVHVHFSTQILNQTHILCIRNKNYVEEKMKWTIFAYPLISICADTWEGGRILSKQWQDFIIVIYLHMRQTWSPQAGEYLYMYVRSCWRLVFQLTSCIVETFSRPDAMSWTFLNHELGLKFGNYGIA